MFPGYSGIELEPSFLRSGRRFKFDKQRKTPLWRGSCITDQEKEGYKIPSYLDEGSCDEEEEYHLISEGYKESEESTESWKQEHAYESPTVPEVRSRDLSPSNSLNTSNTNIVNSGQGSQTSPTFVMTVTSANTMVGDKIKFPIFNGNGLEDLEQHWFLCEVIWTVRQI